MSDKRIQTGIEDVSAAETRLSKIDGDAGELVICGFSLSELAGTATFEETLYLLYNDELPTSAELTAFTEQLAAYRSLPQGSLDVLRAAAEAKTHPMDALRMGTAAATLDLDDEAPERDALALVARLPSIVASYWRFRNGFDHVEPQADLSHVGNYLYMLTGEFPTDARIRGLETYLNTVIDHGLNASTFTARTIVSTESDVVSAITGAIGALKGPRHGGAPQPVLDMLLELEASGDIDGHIRRLLADGERLMGFGHRVYRVRDPRAAVLSSAAEQFYQSDGDAAFFELATAVETQAVELLKEHKPDHKLQTNVEFYTAVLLHGIGIPSELFTPTFAVARVGGWTAHCLEQLADNRLIRPRATYTGETDRGWVPRNER